MSYLSFENNIIEASGNLILKPTSGSIDCSEATISNVTIAGNMVVSSIEPSNNDISFNGSNLLDVSSIQVNNDVSCSSLLVDTIGIGNHNISFNGSNLLDVSSIQVNRIDATDIYVDGSLTVINTIDLDISDNIIGLNRGHTGDKNTSGILINYAPDVAADVSNIFFGYHENENAFVIADTSYNHNDPSRDIVIDNYVDLKVGNIQGGILKAFYDNNTYIETVLDSSQSYIHFLKNNKTTLIGYVDESNDVFYINNNSGMIQLKRTDISLNPPYFDIGRNISGSTSGTLDDYKHESNVMIQARSFKAEYIDENNIYYYIKTVLDSSLSNIELHKGINKCVFGYSNPSNNALHILNNDNIYLGRKNSDGSLNFFDIGKNNGGTEYKHESNVMIEAPSFKASINNDNTYIETVLDSSQCYIEFFKNRTTSSGGSVGFANKYNNVLHILNNDYIHIKHDINDALNIDPYLNIGKNYDVTKYKHESNVMIEAPSFNATSDYRTKTNIEELNENITVSNLRPLMYLKNGQKEIGLLAHELQEVYPFMVCGEKDGKEMQSVNYNGLIGVLINDVKRLLKENQILKLNNYTLKSDYDTLKSRIDSLEEKFNKKFE